MRILLVLGPAWTPVGENIPLVEAARCCIVFIALAWDGIPSA
jgi:hypothetical protein